MAVIMIRQAARNRSTSKVPSSRRNFMRFRDARLQLVSSRNMYSLHGLDALMGPVFGQVWHRWIVSSYWRPGSPQVQVPSAILPMSCAAL